MKRFFSLSFLLLLTLSLPAQDSLHVERLLRQAPKATSGELMLFFARQFLGVPYVAHTLEQAATEDTLVVNLRQMDCTTLVETCTALTLTAQAGSHHYADYKTRLNRIRYRQGRRDGYASRNHYFHQWVRSNEALGIVQEIKSAGAPFTALQRISLRWMSQHPKSYPQLGDEKQRTRVAQYEKACDGDTRRYIPRAQLNGTRKGALGIVRDGDILGIVTRKHGLDTTHLGIAVWGKDGKLHLLNASSIHKKVVEEPMTLYEYMGKHPSQLGIRVVRVQ